MSIRRKRVSRKKTCHNCKNSWNESHVKASYWLWCRELYCYVRGHANRCNCMHYEKKC